VWPRSPRRMAATETTIQVVYLSVPASCLQSGTLEFLPFRRTTISLVRRGCLDCHNRGSAERSIDCCFIGQSHQWSIVDSSDIARRHNFALNRGTMSFRKCTEADADAVAELGARGKFSPLWIWCTRPLTDKPQHVSMTRYLATSCIRTGRIIRVTSSHTSASDS
jgi:hypothetical protein